MYVKFSVSEPTQAPASTWQMLHGNVCWSPCQPISTANDSGGLRIFERNECCFIIFLLAAVQSEVDIRQFTTSKLHWNL